MSGISNRHSTILSKSPPGLSLAQRRARAKLPTLTIRLDAGALQILTAAADHRRKPVEKLASDILEGTCFLGSIPQQEAKAFRYRQTSEKEKIAAKVRASVVKAHDTRKQNREIACGPTKAASGLNSDVRHRTVLAAGGSNSNPRRVEQTLRGLRWPGGACNPHEARPERETIGSSSETTNL